MKISTFLKDCSEGLLVLFLNMLVCSFILRLMGNSWWTIISLDLLSLSFLFAYMIKKYMTKNKMWAETNEIMEKLDHKYLITEILSEPNTEEGKMYFDLLSEATRSMLENVAIENREKKEYQELIECWVHEIKSPITGAKLICENNKYHPSEKILLELKKIENEVEKILYFARMDNVSNDYRIEKVNLRNCINSVLRRNKQILIKKNACIRTDNRDIYVYSDEKWIVFIINQIILNSVKYMDKILEITISTYNGDNNVVLSIKDNGIGIRKEEINRIFDKGFTGINGNINVYSTGLGLYICKALSDKMGIKLQVKSTAGIFTEMLLVFPVTNTN